MIYDYRNSIITVCDRLSVRHSRLRLLVQKLLCNCKFWNKPIKREVCCCLFWSCRYDWFHKDAIFIDEFSFFRIFDAMHHRWFQNGIIFISYCWQCITILILGVCHARFSYHAGLFDVYVCVTFKSVRLYVGFQFYEYARLILG